MDGADARVAAAWSEHGARSDSPSRAAWLSMLAVGLMFSLPLVQPRHTHPITSFYSEWLALVLGTVALVPLLLRRHTAPLQVPWVTAMPVLLALVLVVHLLLVKSPYPQQPALAIVYLVWSAGLVMTASVLRRDFGTERLVVMLAWFTLAGGLLNAIAGVLQHYEWRGPLEPLVATKLYFQVYGNLGQPNHFSTHMAISLVSLGFLHATRRIRPIWLLAAAALMLFVLSLSGSRSAWLYLASVGLAAALSYRMARSGAARRALGFALALLPGLALAHFIAGLPWLAPPTLHTTVIDRLFQLAATPSERLQLWRGAWHMFMEAPLMGVGWGQFAWHNFMLVGTLDGPPLRELYNHAHNLFFHLLAETGLLGASVALLGVVLWARNAWPALARPDGWWIWGCMAVLGVHSMLEYPLWNAYFLGIACVVAGAGDGRCLRLHQARLVRAGVWLFVAGTLWTSAVMLDRYHRLEGVMHARYRQHDRIELQHAHRDMLAVRESFFLAPYVELAYARDIALSVSDIDRSLAFTARVMRFAPTGLVSYRHAALHALRGNEEEARQLLRRAATAYPTLLERFASEFAQAQTGDAERHARFLALLQQLIEERRAAGRAPAW